MNTTESDINRIFSDIQLRCGHIRTSTIKSLLKGKFHFESPKAFFSEGKQPSLEEVAAAFHQYDCTILTAFRGGYTFDENMQRNEKLKADMNDVGLEFSPVRGCYREAEWEHPNVENCFFVVCKDEKKKETFFHSIYQLSEKYDQDSFLYKSSGINPSAFLVATNDDGRKEFRGDIKFAGQLFKHVPNVDAWSDARDGRFAFMLKGMILIETEDKKIKIGEGDIFDTQGYDATGIVVITKSTQKDLVDGCKAYNGARPLAKHIFAKDSQSETSIHDTIIRAMKIMRDNRCRRIGFHCSAMIDDSSESAAKVAYNTICEWAKRNRRKFDWIVIVDIFGDYSKIIKANKL